MKKAFLTFIAAVLMTLVANAQTHREQVIRNWDFSRDGQTWQNVTVPHDWAISGPFDKKWDLQVVAIVQNGEKEKSEKSGRSGSLPWIGEGHYRTTLNIMDEPGHAELVFDGAMSEPVVYVNGHEAGRWAYGYNAFHIDVTPYLYKGENQIAVDLKNVEESSRWYPGGGIYRPVKLVTTGNTYIDDWSIYVRTMSADDEKAVVEAEAKVVNPERNMTGNMVLTGPDGRQATSDNIRIGTDGKIYAKFNIQNPQLWSPETPYLYNVKVEVNKKSGMGAEQQVLVDKKEIKTGIRTIRVSREHGFQLNGQTRKLKGVCLHHDLGPLGAAVNKAALIRQVKILKDMGCDAIRTSHNMPSTMQMEVYDSLGMMVMAESFDMWIYPKYKNGYARFFKEWAERDIENLVLNHRNHPSLVMWSIGNEIPEQWSEEGRQISIRLQGLCHLLDPSRPVTQGLDRVDEALRSGFAQAMDIPGFNYRVNKYDKGYKVLTHGYLLGSETASTVSSRGIYKFPVEYSNRKTYDDGQCSGYDVEYCSWSNVPDVDFSAMDDNTWTIGQFVWTGFDYLGEPTPYDGYWPSRSSYFGICDLAGLPKDRFYLYRSQWNTQEHTIHLLPHWTWPGREGEVTPVYCYTDYPSAELFVNGKSQGKVTKKAWNKSERVTAERNQLSSDELLNRYRLRWNDVRYEPGELKVVVYDDNGNKAGEKVVRTAGKPVAMKLEADRTILSANGDDLAYVTVSLVDKNGVEIPDATDQLTFEVKGSGTFRAVCNGDATSLEPFTQPTMKLFSGKLVVTVQSGSKPGNLQLIVKDKTRKKLQGKITIGVK